jgi:hypothetical protein
MGLAKWTKKTNANNRAFMEVLDATYGNVKVGKTAKESRAEILEKSNNGKDLNKAIEIALRERARRAIGLKAMRLIQADINRTRVRKGFSPLVPKKDIKRK